MDGHAYRTSSKTCITPCSFSVSQMYGMLFDDIKLRGGGPGMFHDCTTIVGLSMARPIRYAGKGLRGSAMLAELGSKFAIQSIVFLRAFLDSSSHLQHISTCWTNVSFVHFAIAI